MASGMSITLAFRIEPAVREGLRAAAEREHRSIANMVGVLPRDYCARNGVTIPTPGALEDGRKPIKGKNEQSPKPKNTR